MRFWWDEGVRGADGGCLEGREGLRGWDDESAADPYVPAAGWACFF